jgi:hypothetical protein
LTEPTARTRGTRAIDVATTSASVEERARGARLPCSNAVVLPTEGQFFCPGEVGGRFSAGTHRSSRTTTAASRNVASRQSRAAATTSCQKPRDDDFERAFVRNGSSARLSRPRAPTVSPTSAIASPAAFATSSNDASKQLDAHRYSGIANGERCSAITASSEFGSLSDDEPSRPRRHEQHRI